MYLRALEIQGFKSFPDKTVLNFAEDITAIVGPNGSGKSNVSDAILWVMGEQSAKGLRGSKMEDVIFSGSETRNQTGFAQVTLVLDNTEHIFPTMEESEVSVTRRYYRSGESEYYINKQSVRLKDVTELFLDTGMGKEGYSIIGQGKIDEILSTKSQDRREIFEEAAGIAKFRHRKEESERKLQHTEENLVRINDKIAELELQVEPLRDQSERAKKYLVYHDEQRVLEISVWLDQLEAIKAGARKLRSDYEQAVRERDELQEKVNALYDEAETFSARNQEKDLEAERIRMENAELEGKAAEEESALAVLQSEITHNEENIQRAKQEQQDTQNRADGLRQQAVEQEQRSEEMLGEIHALEKTIEALMQEARETAARVGGATEEAEALRARESLAVSESADARAEIAALEAEMHQIQERKTQAAEELERNQEQLQEQEAAAKKNRRALEDAREEQEAIANMIQGHTMRMEERRRRAEEASAKALKLTMDAGAMDNRIRLLSDMEKDYEGFSKAVRIVMQSRQSLHGVHDAVANLMKVDRKCSLAIEIALGAGLQNIVVDSEEDGKKAISFLHQKDGGRATFLPLTTIRGELLKERNLDQEDGFVGIASELITYDPQYQDIFRNLLGRTVVVEDMDSAIALSRKYRQAFRLVTLDGQVVNRGGSMTGGSVTKSGVLSRSAELETLKKQVEDLHRQLENARAAEESAKRELDKATYELETASSQQNQAQNEVTKLEGAREHYEILLNALRSSIENLEGELEAIGGRLQDTQEKKKAAEERLSKAQEEAESFRKQAEETLSGQTGLLEQSNSLAERISNEKQALAAANAEREAALSKAKDFYALAEDLAGDEESRQQVLASYTANIERARLEIEIRTKSAESYRAHHAELMNRLQEIQQEKMKIEQERTQNSNQLKEQNDTLLRLSDAASRLESKVEGAAQEEQQILDRLWERYELSHSDAVKQRIELESMAKANRRIAELKREINALGVINIGAIEEFERVNTRYTYLTEQRDDIDKAKSDLEGIIEEITSQMTVIFKEQFQLLNENFQTTFKELFGGGQAHLELEDETRILDCGIDIKAQPPGKTLKTISLLSGGEKAFVAIALYFAILKVHPTPFCVMDEIEAALDEANVTRTARYMRKLSDRTQFIVITHRRGTMENADVLYGVTMQEQGVSKVLTVNMNDMARELKID